MADYGRIANVLVEPAIGTDPKGRIAHVLVEPALGVDPKGRIAHVLVEPAIGDTSRVRVALAVVEVFCVPASSEELQSVQGAAPEVHIQGSPTKGVP